MTRLSEKRDVQNALVNYLIGIVAGSICRRTQSCGASG
jgi:hypothetical protein